jgi:Tfp pilus assembly protein PilE
MKNDPNSLKCVKCGNVIRQTPEKSASSSGSKALIIVVVVVAGLFVLIAVIGILAAIAIPQFVSYRQRAYEVQTQAMLESACHSAHSFFLDYPDEIVTLDDLWEPDAETSPMVEIAVLDGTRENLMIQASHTNSGTIYIADKDCYIQEIELE